MAICARVAIDDIINKIDKPYDYSVPFELIDKICPGACVIVPFSKNNINKKALVLSLFEKDNIDGLKNIIEVVDEIPPLTKMQLSLVHLLKERYFTTYFRAFKTIVPRGIDIKIKDIYLSKEGIADFNHEINLLFQKNNGKLTKDVVPKELLLEFNKGIEIGLIKKSIDTKRKINDLTEKFIRLKIGQSELETYISNLDKRFNKQIDLLSVFLDYSEISKKDALYYSGCTDSTVKTLEKKGIIESYNKIIKRNPYKDLEKVKDITEIKLTTEQSIVRDNILKTDGTYTTHLINGITGSGKTMVYMSLIDKMIQSGKSVIFMVPEISLTPQTLAKFYSKYGDIVSVIHSALTPRERAEEWKKIKNNQISVTVGTRSAVFSPSNNLGMVIIDEEHEPSYKSESTPRYHTRDIAKYICKYLSIPLVLGSATPSIESCYYAKKSIYKYHTIFERYNNNPLPETQIIDMREAYKEGMQSFLSEQLKLAIEETLSKKEQAILFLNRRGAHTMVGCAKCGYVAKCPSCGIALTHHTANGRCMCHYCGYNLKMFDKCPKCGGKHIKHLGVGTQLVYSELSDMFPNAKILRMDFDTVNSYITYGNELNSFKNKEYDILLGTQMVAKGLDFPNVTLVGVINADLSLYVDDFRANERTFSLLTQVSGRSGRADKIGKSYIQTYSPDYEIIQFAKEQNYNKFYEFEINFRKAMNYPPFCDLLQLTISNFSENKVYREAHELYKLLDSLSKNEFSDIPIRLLYPTVPRIACFNNKFRYNLIVKCRVSKRLYELLDIINNKFNTEFSSELVININPINNI